MKRKKFYSMLALGMAMTLVAGMPVSAAVSPDTGSTDFPVVGDTDTVVKDDNQEVVVGKDEDGTTVYIKVEESVDSNSTIEEIVNKEDSVTTQGGQKVEASEELKVPEAVEDKEQEATLKAESKEQFKNINADEIKADKAGLQITVTPVAAAVQSVAKAAAAKMAEQLGSGNANLLASADISIPNLPKGESVRVTIPMNNEKPDTSKYNYYVLHYDQVNGVWETLPATVTAEGIVVATFNSFSPVFVVKAEKQDNVDNNNNNNNNDNNNNDNNNSSSSGSSSSSSSSSSTDNAKATPVQVANTPVNPAVSPKTGE
jgi:hypothetical protein